MGGVAGAGVGGRRVDVPHAVQPVQLGRPDVSRPAGSRFGLPDDGLARVEEILHQRGLPYLDAVGQCEGEIEDAICGDHPGVWSIDVGDRLVGHGGWMALGGCGAVL